MASERSLAQEVSIACVTCFSSFLSYCGSLLLIRLALRRLRQFKNAGFSVGGGSGANSNPIYQKLMIALCVSDIGGTTGFLLSTFWVLRGHPTSPSFAIGNTTTCSIAGYLASVCFFTSSLCNAFLARYFLLTIRRSWRRPEDFRIRARIWFSILILVPQAIGIAAISTESVNQLDYVAVCWITKANYASCPDNQEGEEICARGSDVSTYLRFCLFGGIVLASLIAIATTIQVWRAYKAIINQSRRYIFTTSTQQVSSQVSSNISMGTSSRNDAQTIATTNSTRTRNDDYLSQVKTQAVYYCLVYANQFVWFAGALVVVQAIDNSHERIGVYIYELITMLLIPLNGMLNALVYILPSYTALQKKYDQKLSKMRIFWLVIIDESKEEIQRQSKVLGNISTASVAVGASSRVVLEVEAPSAK